MEIELVEFFYWGRIGGKEEGEEKKEWELLKMILVIFFVDYYI